MTLSGKVGALMLIAPVFKSGIETHRIQLQVLHQYLELQVTTIANDRILRSNLTPFSLAQKGGVCYYLFMQTKNPSPIESRRRAQIVSATIDVLAKYGGVNASFVRIAKHAGLSSPGFISYHFKNKEQLWREVLQTIIEQRARRIEDACAQVANPTEKLRVALEADLNYLSDNPQVFAAIVETFYLLRTTEGFLHMMDTSDDPVLTNLIDILGQGQQSGEFGAFDPYSMALIIDGARTQFFGQLYWRSRYDVAAFTKTLVAFALKSAKEGLKNE